MTGDRTNSHSHRSVMNRRAFTTACAALGYGAVHFPEALADAAGNEVTITADMVKAAGKSSGLDLTPEECGDIAKHIGGLVKAYDSLRRVEIDNAVQPALTFNPAQPGAVFPTVKRPANITPVDVSIPGSEEELAFLPVTHLAKLIESRQISSLELTKLYLSRLKKYDPVLTCVVTLTEERALSQAKRADEEIAAGRYRGVLHGIPWGVKDLFSVKGYPTTWGTGCYRDRIIDEDATVVRRLDKAGAVLLAKLATGRFASGAKWFGGETKNPWNTEQDSSGSSAGPGSATSAGLVGFAVGTETRGSIAGPSERCGVTGLRPTFGRISRYGAMALSWSMDKPGPLCRSVEDCALVFDAVYGPDGYDRDVVDYPFNWDYSYDVRRMRVGYVETEFSDGIESPGDRAKKNLKSYRAVLDTLRTAGIELVPVELPDFSPELTYIILCTEAAAALDYMNAGMDDLVEDDGSPVKRYPAYRFVPAVEYIQVNRLRTLIMGEMAKLMDRIDAYVSPTFVGPTNYLTNITGHPEVIVPCGFTDEGTPVSISFVGGLYREAELLALARIYQEATDFHHHHPDM